MPDTRSTELDLARGIRDGELSSPQRLGNVAFFALRISGTGTAYRGKLDEFVFRDPKIFLSDDFLERVQGLPVIIEHPETRVLDTDQWRRRVVGAIMLPFVKDDELWGIARIHDADAAEAMEKLEKLSTSPSVILRKGESEKIELKNGKHLLVESDPLLVDHVAIVSSGGVWDKGGEAGPGIEVTERNDGMSDEAEKGKEGEHLDKLLTKLDDCMSKVDRVHEWMDGMGRRLDALERERDDRHRDDRHRDDRHRDRRDDDEERLRRVVADALRRRDASTEQPNPEAGQARPLVADSTEERDPNYDNKMCDAQARADNAYACWGERAPKYLAGESLWGYRRRLLKPHQRHSQRYKGAMLQTITDPKIMEQVEDAIYADSMAASESPEAIAPGCLRAIPTRDPAGHTLTRFVGHPSAWMAQFMPMGQCVKAINPRPPAQQPW